MRMARLLWSSLTCCIIVLVLSAIAAAARPKAGLGASGSLGGGASSKLNTTCLGGEGGAGGGSAGAQVNFGNGWSLKVGVYSSSCPEAEEIVFDAVEAAVARDPRMAASLLRLHFHDCFVNGCDGSVLLDDTSAMVGEKTAPPNLNSLRGFDVVDGIKSRLEQVCPATVSCADVLAIAARDAVALSGGPAWEVEMGRPDSRIASKSAATNSIPAPNLNAGQLVSRFGKLGLSPRDMVALSGGHTIGKARCSTFSSRLSGNGASSSDAGRLGADRAFLNSLQQLCTGGGNSTMALLDLASPATFDNQYYINLMSGQGLLFSDQALTAGGGGVRQIVETYAANSDVFFDDFRKAMIKMGRLVPQGGSGGEVRLNCRVVNSN